MRKRQRTIAAPTSLSGVGLHTGLESTLTFLPAPENTGICFVRTDLEAEARVPASVDLVSDTVRGTTITNEEGVSIRTVEHVLAALVGVGIDNCIVELSAEEPPIADGSSQPFTDLLVKVGFEEQRSPRSYIAVDRVVHYHDESVGSDFTLYPQGDFRASVVIDFANSSLHAQQATLLDIGNEFVSNIAPARTFCLLSEIEALKEMGLIKGGGLDNAIVFVDEGLTSEDVEKIAEKVKLAHSVTSGYNGHLNQEELRFTNEPARHKLLDLVGDLALIGAPIQGHLHVLKPGHKSNVQFAKHLKELALKHKLIKRFRLDSQDDLVMDINAIMEILPHRYPFLLVDRIVDIDRDAGRIVGMKNVTINEPFFQGHFPGMPIMPGVLIVEAMAQTSGMLLTQEIGGDNSKIALFMGINNAKFRKPVVPGDTVYFELEKQSKRFNTVSLSGKAKVHGKVVAQADLTLALVDRE